jgi:dienelactone hydrolase
VQIEACVHEYAGGDVQSRGYLARPTTMASFGAILVVHEGPGLDEHAKRRARMLAELGFTALAVDLYGRGSIAASIEEAISSGSELAADTDRLRLRMSAALDALLRISGVDSKRIAAIGYCLGGTAVLELARSGAEVAGVVSFHGGLATGRSAKMGDIRAKVLVCTGASDPFVPINQVRDFQTEMDLAGADWQVITYGGARHAFTNPAADHIPNEALAYSSSADERSWTAMRTFFDECLVCFGAA